MVNVVHEHKRLAGMLPELFDIEHYRVVDIYREVKNYGTGYCHVAVVVLSDGSCYTASVRESKHQYIRKIWFRKSVGRALKRAVNAKLYKSDEPDFFVSNPGELTPKVRSAVIKNAADITTVIADSGRAYNAFR